MLQENLIPYKYSAKTFTNSIMWLHAKSLQEGKAQSGGGVESFEEYKDKQRQQQN